MIGRPVAGSFLYGTTLNLVLGAGADCLATTATATLPIGRGTFTGDVELVAGLAPADGDLGSTEVLVAGLPADFAIGFAGLALTTGAGAGLCAFGAAATGAATFLAGAALAGAASFLAGAGFFAETFAGAF